MEDSKEWKILKMCSDQMDLIVTSSVTYSKNDYVVIDGLLIAATKGVSLFDTINATSIKAIEKIRNYTQAESCWSEPSSDVYETFRRFFPSFERYITDFKNHVASSSQFYETRNNYGTTSPANYSWNAESYNPNFYLTKSYTTATSSCVTVKQEPREIKIVNRKMIHERQNHIDQSNIGFKMLLGLGWSGGPLGAKEDGISEPISVELRARRSGLGCTDRKSNKSTYGNINNDTFFQFLKEYADNADTADLEFSDDFSNKEKKKLFGISKDLNLLYESEHRNGMLVVKIMKPNYNNYH